LDYSSQIKHSPFDTSLFVEIRKQLGSEFIAEVNDRICEFSQDKTSKKNRASPKGDELELNPTHKGEVIFDATVCPRDIAYPTDIGLLDRFREIVEAMIDDLHATHPQRKEVQKLSTSSQKMLSKDYSK